MGAMRLLHIRIQDRTFCGYGGAEGSVFPYDTDTACLPHKTQDVIDHGGFVLCGVCRAEYALHHEYAYGITHSCGCAVCDRV